jgi:hypothetical protein
LAAAAAEEVDATVFFFTTAGAGALACTRVRLDPTATRAAAAAAAAEADEAVGLAKRGTDAFLVFVAADVAAATTDSDFLPKVYPLTSVAATIAGAALADVDAVCPVRVKAVAGAAVGAASDIVAAT